MTQAESDRTLSYPRQEALTRRFRLGAPRSFAISPYGDRTLFIRSSSGRDAAGSLWCIDDAGNETCIVDVSTLLLADDADLPDAERARRERMREVTSGITGYSVDAGFSRVAFVVDGTPFTAAVDDPQAGCVQVAAPGPVVDPRISPDGRLVAYVADNCLVIANADGTGEPRILARPESETHSWGLADFVAAEELDRHRGLWWMPDSMSVLAEYVDETDVSVHWISDPAQPTNEPREHRYPAAGTANPVARLFRVSIDGSQNEIAWDRSEFPYLASVHVQHSHGATVSLLTRAQDRQLILHVPTAGEVTILATRETKPWVTVQGGVPCLDIDGSLLEIVADSATDTFRLLRSDQPVTPPGVQVMSILDISDDAITVFATDDPAQSHVMRIDREGVCTWITEGLSYDMAVAEGSALVVLTADLERPGSRIDFIGRGGRAAIRSQAETPVVRPRVHLHSLGAIDIAVLLPTGHVTGTKLPVVMAPYGGPHHNRVVHSANSFASDQWLADQGFAVVVVDGSGTPGRGPAREFAVHHDLAACVLRDQVEGLRHAGHLYPDLDLDRVGITGWSFGGYLAALAVLDRPDVFHAAVAGAPVTEWRLYDTAYTERYLGLPDDQPDVYNASSLLTRAANLTRPLMIIHGLADDNVLAAHTLRLSSALLEYGRPHTVLPLSGVTHMTPQEVVAENLLLLEVDFLRTHLQE